MQDATSLAEAYYDLKNNFITDNVCAFFQACWLLPEGRSFIENSLERMIYVEGDQNEIYSSKERSIIRSVTDSVFSCKFELLANAGIVPTRLVAIKIESDNNAVYDSIALMKVFNKAFNGYTVFLIVSDAGIHIGCSLLKKEDAIQDCMLSPPIGKTINWEQLYDLFLSRNNSKRFYEYYSGVVSTIEGIRYCFSTEEQPAYWQSYDYDNDFLEDIKGFCIDDYINRVTDGESLIEGFDFECFDDEIRYCCKELSHIKKSRINPLELLFEAEEALAIAEKQNSEESSSAQAIPEGANIDDVEFIDDPIALMKKLKKDRGL